MIKNILFIVCLVFSLVLTSAYGYNMHGGRDADVYWVGDYYKLQSVYVTGAPYYSYYNIKSFEKSFYDKKYDWDFKVEKKYVRNNNNDDWDDYDWHYDAGKKDVKKKTSDGWEHGANKKYMKAKGYGNHWDFEAKKKYMEKSYDDEGKGEGKNYKYYSSAYGRYYDNVCYTSPPKGKLFYRKC